MTMLEPNRKEPTLKPEPMRNLEPAPVSEPLFTENEGPAPNRNLYIIGIKNKSPIGTLDAECKGKLISDYNIDKQNRITKINVLYRLLKKFRL